ncbi:LPS-assembly protein LptD [Salinibius halmophilus]|uniref:LPS-assembly protein LptD n=1 Tax=Salinibius halmophilus TaxID=1853216 RepID=UPI000E670E8F|nr:LPS assembly protein LptD [Salinibius halmophilus]
MPKPLSPYLLFAMLPAWSLADWQPIDQVPAGLRQQISPACTGAFIDPFVAGDANQIQYQGDFSEYSLSNNEYLLSGNASVLQGNQFIAGDSITFNRETGVANVSGQYEVREPGFYGQGSRVLRDETGAFRASDGRFVLHDSQLNGFAEQYEQLPSGKVRLRNVSFSRCAPDSNTWRVGSHRLTIDRQAGRAQAISAWVNVYGVPVLWVPYLSIPLTDQRATGLLTPTVKFGGDGLLPTAISQPLYLNLAPNYDSTLTWHWYKEVGSRPDVEIRYLTQRHQGQLDASRFIATRNFANANPELSSRWYWQFSHQGQPTENLSLQIKAADASDPQWQQDFAFADDPVTSYDQYAKLKWRQGNWQAGLLIDRTEPAKPDEQLVLADRKFRLWPQITLGYQTSLPSQIRGQANSELTQFSKPDIAALAEQVSNDLTVNRWRNQITLSRSWGSTALPGQISAQATSIQHWLDYEDEWPQEKTTPQAAIVPSLNVSQGMRLTSEPNRLGVKFSFEPNVRYLYVPLVNEQQFNPVVDTKVASDQYSNPSRFSGGDALADLERVQFSLTHRILVDGQTKFSAQATQGLKLAQERLTIKGDQFIIADVDPDWQQVPTGIQLKAAWTPRSDLEFSGVLEFDYIESTSSRWLEADSYGLAKRNFALHYGGQRQFLNLAWQREGLEDEAQFDDELKASGQIRLSDTLGVLAGATWHNEEGKYNNVSLRKVVYGAEWDSCCSHIRVAYQQDIAPKTEAGAPVDDAPSPFASIDDGLFIEVRLKGVAAHNDGIDELLSQFKGYAGRLFQFR